MKKTINQFFAFVALALATLTSCNSSSGDNPSVESFLTFATLTASNEMGSTFTAQEDGDSPVVTFTSTVELNTKVYTLGERYIINYSNDSKERFKSGPIDLYGVYGIGNGKAEVKSQDDIARLQRDPIDVTSAARTGKYINLVCNAAINSKARNINLYFDETTADDEYPVAYVGFESDNAASSPKTFYASIDVSTVWNKQSCKGITLKFENNGMVKNVKFEKSGMDITPAE